MPSRYVADIQHDNETGHATTTRCYDIDPNKGTSHQICLPCKLFYCNEGFLIFLKIDEDLAKT